MPYINQKQRSQIDISLDYVIQKLIDMPDFEKDKGGILNYVFTRISLGSMKNKNYSQLSLIKSALDNASAEWYRKQMGPYEDEKIEQNGDVEWIHGMDEL